MLTGAPDEVTLLFDGERVLVRSIDQVAAIEADALKLVLESRRGEGRGRRHSLRRRERRVPEVMRAEVAQATAHPIEWIDTESDVTALAHLAAAFPGTPPAINLLQGTLAPPTQGGNSWVRWRGVAALLGIWLSCCWPVRRCEGSGRRIVRMR